MTNWNVKREKHTTKELEALVADAKAELEDALWRHGDGSRGHTEAVNTLRFYQRRLDDAKDREARRQDDDKRDPAEIVDRVMRP
jgi:hypothetical protein